MSPYEACRRYLEALNRKDLVAIRELFVEEARVVGPITGVLSVETFHTRIFGYNKRAIARIVNVFGGLSVPGTIAVQLSYTWVLNDGKTLILNGMVVFEMDADLGKLKQLSFIYDATELRHHLSEQQIESMGLG